jgi:hypothetical protein
MGGLPVEAWFDDFSLNRWHRLLLPGAYRASERERQRGGH